MKKKTTVLIVVCLLAAILFYYSRIHGFRIHTSSYGKTKPDDSISKVFSESVDTKWMYYGGKNINNEGTVTIYRFYINKEKEGLAEAAAEAVNEVLVQEKTQNRICIEFREIAPAGAIEPLFSLLNYYQAGSLADYGKLQCLIIFGTRLGRWDSIYNDPETYKNFPDIRCLIVEEKIQKAAKEKGIDWYGYWPELEMVSVSPDLTDSRTRALCGSLDAKWMQYWGKTTEGGGIAPTSPLIPSLIPSISAGSKRGWRKRRQLPSMKYWYRNIHKTGSALFLRKRFRQAVRKSYSACRIITGRMLPWRTMRNCGV